MESVDPHPSKLELSLPSTIPRSSSPISSKLNLKHQPQKPHKGYRHPFTQIFIVSIVCFSCPGQCFLSFSFLLFLQNLNHEFNPSLYQPCFLRDILNGLMKDLILIGYENDECLFVFLMLVWYIGIYNSLSGLGGGGQLDATAADNGKHFEILHHLWFTFDQLNLSISSIHW